MDLVAVDNVRKAQIVGILEYICQALELTAAQHKLAKSRYEAVGRWLADSDDALPESVTIYPQGSVPLGTTVRPIGRNEHDVDLICFVAGLASALSPATLKYAIGNRLRDNDRYRAILEEMPRCWRLNYAGEFHLDITPSISNPNCKLGGELVPDKELKTWKPSNPKGYRAWFEERARLQPRIRGTGTGLVEGFRADLEPFPERMGLKGLLRRTVQLEKRHRDIYFEKLGTNLGPISIIITTLAARSYTHCATVFEYDSELDLVRDVVRHMPDFIEDRVVLGRRQWFIWNDTTVGENFAEKWNTEPARAEAFFEWHANATADLDRIVELTGLDRLAKSLRESFGEAPVSQAMRSLTDRVSRARDSGHLAVARGVGLIAATGVGTTVRPNTFFGVD